MALASFCHSELQEMVRSAVLLSPIAYLNQIGPAFVRIGVELFVPEVNIWGSQIFIQGCIRASESYLLACLQIFNRMGVRRFFPFG